MRAFVRLSSVIALATACMGPEKFDKQNAEQLCLLFEECEVLDMYGYSSTEECDSSVKGAFDDCEDFDQEAAKRCIENLEKMDCEDAYAERFPSACNKACKDPVPE
jgi:hypothetical protein